MERKVIIQDWQKVSSEDFNNFGNMPRESFDDLIGNVLIPDKAYAGFAVAESGTAEVTVGAGRLLYQGVMYLNDTEGGTVISLLANLPAATQRYVAIAVWGQDIETETEPRTFLTDVTTRATVARAVSTESRRWANVSTVVGTEGPDPQKPAVAANVVAVAYVLLDTSGVVSVEANELDRVPTLREADNRLNAFDAWKSSIGARIDTLASDLAGLAARLKDTAKQSFVMELARDLASTKETSNLPDAYVFWGSDHFLDLDESLTSHVDWLAAVEEGIRFPDAAVSSSQISLLNQFDPNAHQQDFFVLPVFEERARIAVEGKDGEVNVSTYQYQTQSQQLMHRSRWRWRFGSWYQACTNAIFYNRRDPVEWLDRVEGIFKIGSETWQLHPAYLEDHIKNHITVRIRRVWVDSWIEHYLETVTTQTNISGAVISQTFLNSQDGWLTSIDLNFTRVAGTGDVQVAIANTLNGAPDLSQVISRTTLSQANMRTYPTRTNLPIVPLFLAAGKRYAIVLTTGANHYVAVVNNNKYAQGSFFYSTDEQWFQGDLEKDMSFRLNFASFAAARYEVNLQPVTLSGGIAGIDILCDAVIPGQCQISWEVQAPGGDWMSMNLQAGMVDDIPFDPFIGLPPLLSFRAVLIGTTDAMPGFGVSSNSRIMARRPRSDFTHISTERTTPSNVDRIDLTLKMEEWRGAVHHQVIAKIIWGDSPVTTENHDALVQYPDPGNPFVDEDNPGGWIQEYTFSGMTNNNNFKIRIEGDTDNVLACFHVAERVDVCTLET